MTTVKFANGKEIPYSVCYVGQEVLGIMQRPTLNFEIVRTAADLDELDALLSDAGNLGTITLVNDGTGADTPAEKSEPVEEVFYNYSYYARTTVYPAHTGEGEGYISFVLGQRLPIEIENMQHKEEIAQLESKLNMSRSK